MKLTICPGCQRHVRLNERICPFCGHSPAEGFVPQIDVPVPARASRSVRYAIRAAIVSSALASACGASSGLDVNSPRDAGAPIPVAVDAGVDAGDLPIPFYGSPPPRDAGPVEPDEDAGGAIIVLYGGAGG
jgi:hypothetical protein